MPAHTHPDEPEASPVIISETRDHIVIALEISRSALARHVRFIEALLAAARTAPDRG